MLNHAAFAAKDKYNFLTYYCYLLTLNVDWFHPFSHSMYSVGAIYLTVQNLPRDQQYKEQNIILVGVIPGLKEPKSYQLTHIYHHLWKS